MAKGDPIQSAESPERSPLRRLLALASDQGVSSESALASSLGIPKDLVREMCRELERAGYLRTGTPADTPSATPRRWAEETKYCGGCEIRELCLLEAAGPRPRFSGSPRGQGPRNRSRLGSG
jgi:hypothetical protein